MFCPPPPDTKKVQFDRGKARAWSVITAHSRRRGFCTFLQFISSTLATRRDLQVVCEVSNGLEAIQKTAELRPDLILLASASQV